MPFTWSCVKMKMISVVCLHFVIYPKNVLLPDDSAKEQCKCQLHENLSLKLEAMGCSYESSWRQTVLRDISPNSPCWNNTCDDHKDGKKLIARKRFKCFGMLQTVGIHWSTQSLEKQRWWYLQENCHCNEGSRVGEVLDKFQESFAKVKEHQNVKQIQAVEFQNDLKDEWVRVLQIDYAIA